MESELATILKNKCFITTLAQKVKMDSSDREQTLEYTAKAHALVEKSYLNNPAVPNSEEWLNKRRLLLADLSLHLTDACIREKLNVEKIKRYLHSLLIIAHDFAPDAELQKTAERLLPGTA